MSEFIVGPAGFQDPGAPRSLGSIPYTDLVAGGTYTWFVGGLSRMAKARSVVVTNATDVTVTGLTWEPFDSTLSTLNNTGSSASYNMGGVAAGSYGQYTSETGSAAGLLAAHFNSIALEITIGATAPTSGEIALNVVEIF